MGHVQQFSRLLFLNKFELWVSCEAVCDIFDQFATFLISFSTWFFKMEFNTLPDLLKSGFTIVEISLFYGGEHLGAKI